jgi:type II secretory pathway pseudopilin PulG
MRYGQMLSKSRVKFNSNGFTIFEIVLSTIIVSILMMGIISANVTLQKSAMDASNSFFVTSTTQSALTKILDDASQATGYLSNVGIAIGTGTSPLGNGSNAPSAGGANNFCFAVPVTSANGWFPPNTSQAWSCYTWSNNNIYNCTRPTAGTCPTTSTWIGSSKQVPTVTATLINTGGSQRALVNVIIENCLLPSRASCCDPEDESCVTDPTNFYIKKEGSVTPSGLASS